MAYWKHNSHQLAGELKYNHDNLVSCDEPTKKKFRYVKRPNKYAYIFLVLITLIINLRISVW